MIVLYFLFLGIFAQSPCQWFVTIEGATLLYGSTVDDGVEAPVECRGPAYTGTTQIYQCSNGNWVPKTDPVDCQKVQCANEIDVTGYPGDNNEYTATCTEFDLDDRCVVNCASGFSQGQSTFTCGQNGWEGTLPSCQAITCQSTISFTTTHTGADDTVVCADTSFDAECTAQCSQAYQGDPIVYKCGAAVGSNGSWQPKDGVDLSCSPRSCDSSLADSSSVQTFSVPVYSIETLANAEATCRRSVYGSQCTVSCIPGWGLNTQNFICDLNQVNASPEVIWTLIGSDSLLTCARNDCGSTIRTVEGNSVYSYSCDSGTLFEDTCNVECGNGYEGTGTTYTCGTNEWEGTSPTCTKKQCATSINDGDMLQIEGVLTAIADVHTPLCSTNDFGDTCTAQCKHGFGTSSELMECTYHAGSGDVVWEAVSGSFPVCVRNDCGPSIRSVAGREEYTYACASTVFEDTCTVQCSLGYTGTSQDFTCGAEEWEGTTPTCVKQTCDATMVDGSTVQINGALTAISNVDSTCGSNSFTDSCTAMCQHGWGSNSEVMQCAVNPDQTGVVWTSSTGTLPACAKNDCGATIQNLGVFYDYTCENTLFTDTCQVGCNQGYTGDPSTYTCGASTWEGSPPICQPISCGDYEPYKAPNTEVVGECSGNYPESCTFQCTEGFLPSTMTLHCVTSGEWFGVNITCSAQSFNVTETTINNTEDRTTEWVIFWILVACGSLAAILCCAGYIYIKTDPDGDKRGIGKKGLTKKQRDQLHDTMRLQIFESDEWKKMRSFLMRQETRHDVFDGVESTPMTSSSGISLEIEDKRRFKE